MSFADRLDAAVGEVRNPCLVGIDPHLDLLPEEFAVARQLSSLVPAPRDAPAYLLRNVVPDPGRWIRFQVLERSGRAALNRRDRLVLSSGLLRLFPACALLRLVLIIPPALSGAFLLQGLGESVIPVALIAAAIRAALRRRLAIFADHTLDELFALASLSGGESIVHLGPAA